MKTKFFTILSLVLFAFTNVKSQAPVEVSGQIKDAESKKALEFCTVSAFNKKDSLITGTVSDESGYFTLNLPRGTYKFKISFIGYKTDSLPTTMVGSDKFLGVFKLKPEVKILGEYSVKTNSQDNLIDRDVQIVTDKMKVGTSSTKEVLDKMDGVEYDRYSKAIKVDNSDKVIILVDGVEKDQEYVKNLSPDRLKKIEVIRDPSGKYALEGYTAVINVILKNDYQGTEIQLNNENLFDIDAPRSKDIFLTNSSAATFNYTYNKVNIYTKYRNNLNNFSFGQNLDRVFYGNNDTVVQQIQNMPTIPEKSENIYRNSYNNLTYGLDYNLNPKNSFSFEGNYSFQPKNYNINKTIDTNKITKYGELTDFYTNNYVQETKSNSSYYSLFYNGKLDEKHSFKANVTYSNYNENIYNESKTFDLINDSLSNLYNIKDENSKNKLKSFVEYYYAINDKHNIQIGYGNSFEELKTTREFKLDTISVRLNDNRNKLYSYYSFQPNKKFGIKIGIAIENTLAKNDKMDKPKSYFKKLPYLDVKYKLNNLLDFKFKYRANSNYPTIDQITMSGGGIENFTINKPNYSLNPDVIHKFSFQINVMGGLAKVEPYYNFSNDFISQTLELDANNNVVFSYNNIGKYEEKGVMVNFTVPFGKSIFWQNDFNIYSPKLEYKGQTNKYTDYTMNSQVVYVNEPLDLVTGAKYQKGMRKFPSLNGYFKGNVDFWLLFAQKSFFNKNFSVMVAYITPFTYGVDTEQGSVLSIGNRYKESRIININDVLKNIAIIELTYRFNKGKSVKKKDKDVEIINERSSKGLM